MRKIIIAVSQYGQRTTEFCFRFEPEPSEDPFDSLRRFRAAVFLTGVAIERAKMNEGDRELIASIDLLRTMNGVLQVSQRRNDSRAPSRGGPVMWVTCRLRRLVAVARRARSYAAPSHTGLRRPGCPPCLRTGQNSPRSPRADVDFPRPGLGQYVLRLAVESDYIMPRDTQRGKTTTAVENALGQLVQGHQAHLCLPRFDGAAPLDRDVNVLDPIIQALRSYVLSAQRIHADEGMLQKHTERMIVMI